MYRSVCVQFQSYMHIEDPKVLLAVQSVPFLSTLGPAGACSSFSHCPAQCAMRNRSRTSSCLNLGAGLHVPEQHLCQRCPWGCEDSGLSLVKHRRAAFSLSLHLPPFPEAKQEAGPSLGEVNQRGFMDSRRLVGLCGCQCHEPDLLELDGSVDQIPSLQKTGTTSPLYNVFVCWQGFKLCVAMLPP